jgi:hypothetical protein
MRPSGPDAQREPQGSIERRELVGGEGADRATPEHVLGDRLK